MSNKAEKDELAGAMILGGLLAVGVGVICGDKYGLTVGIGAAFIAFVLSVIGIAKA